VLAVTPVVQQHQVRCACVGEIGIITGSRDATIKVWAEESPTAYALRSTLVRRVRLPRQSTTAMHPC
jgi:hypothetical protein